MEYVTPTCSVLALFLAYFAISREGRADLKDSFRKGLRLARKGFRAIIMVVIVVGPALISWDSYNNVAAFRDSSEPVTRREIVFMLLHAFNFGMYFIFCMASIGFIASVFFHGRKQKASDEEDSPSDKELSGQQ